jgi:cation transport ATPase
VSEPESFEHRIGRGVLAMMDGEFVIVGKRCLLDELEIVLPEKNYKWAVQKFSSLVEAPI